MVQENIKVNIAIINNGYLGMVRQWQEFFYERNYAATPLVNPDFTKIAEAYGILTFAVTHRDEVAPTVRKAREHDGPGADRFPRGAGRFGLSHGSGGQGAARDDSPAKRHRGDGDRRVNLMNMTYLLDVANHTGVVTRISLIFRRHGANLQSLSTAKTEHPSIVRIVITSEIERRPAERIKGQLAKLVDVFKVDMISHEEGTFRAFGMMKIACTLQTRPQILQLLEIFNGRVLELTTEWVLVEMTGTPEQLEGLLQVLQPYGILEAVETGPIVIRRNSPRNAARPQPTWEVVPGALSAGVSSTSTSTSNSTQERKRNGTDLL